MNLSSKFSECYNKKLLNLSNILIWNIITHLCLFIIIHLTITRLIIYLTPTQADNVTVRNKLLQISAVWHCIGTWQCWQYGTVSGEWAPMVLKRFVTTWVHFSVLVLNPLYSIIVQCSFISHKLVWMHRDTHTFEFACTT